MIFVSLASGSKGNAALINTGRTRILVDCGISARKANEALKRLGLSLKEIDALLLTHEHSDHIKGVKRLMQAYGIPVYATRGTLNQLLKVTRDDYFSLAGRRLMEEIFTDRELTIGDVSITPFRIYHDVAEPCAYRFEVWQGGQLETGPGRTGLCRAEPLRQGVRQHTGIGQDSGQEAGSVLPDAAGSGQPAPAQPCPVKSAPNEGLRKHVQLAVMTDCGHYDDYIAGYLKGLDAMLLEANHDINMLERGPYPPFLKLRIKSPFGHLSNESSGMLLTKVLSPRLKAVLLGHLSHENNTPGLALSTVAGELAVAFGGGAGHGSGLDAGQGSVSTGADGFGCAHNPGLGPRTVCGSGFGPDISVAPQDGLSRVIEL